MLEAAKDKHIVAPGINWLIATLHDAEAVSMSSLLFDRTDAESLGTRMRRRNK
jgi:hypothetical protein